MVQWLRIYLPTWEMLEMQVRPLGREDPLEKKMAPTPVFLPGESPWTEEPGGAAVHGVADSDMTERLSMHAYMPEINLF